MESNGIMKKGYFVVGFILVLIGLSRTRKGQEIMTNIIGPTRGERNNNPGNIKKSNISWQGLSTVQPDSVFASFISPEAGIRALAKTLLTYYNTYGLRSISAIVSRWAPPSENDTAAYINSVSNTIGFLPSEILDLTDPQNLSLLTKAIIKHENGRVSYDDETIEYAVNLALA